MSVRRATRATYALAAALAAQLVVLALGAPVAQARGRDLLERISPDFEVFGARNLDALGQDAFALGAGAAVHVELNLVRSLGVHAGAQLFVLGPGDIDDSVFYFGSQSGLRFHWSTFVDAVPGDAWIEVHHLFGRSGGISRHGAGGGVGYGLPVADNVSLGPFVRFAWMSDPGLSDPMIIFGGVALGLESMTRLGEEIPDTDLDGVPDFDDVCPDEPMGEHEDPERAGCPARDRDGDGLVDPLDACPSETMWPYPNREEEGCPLPDRDADGVPDSFDQCPDEFAPDGGDPLREGCIEGDDDF